MKTFVKIIAFFLLTYTVKAQAVVEITNNTNCTLLVQMYSVATGTCAWGSFQNYILTPGSGVAAVAPAGDEWIYAEITSFPYCTGGVGLAVGTPMSCSSTCSWGVGSNVTVGNSGCNGCKPNVNAQWIDHCGHPGTLNIIDF
ncbi:MAG: hypothetical protein AAGA77_11410 [Bacteroidota bacterium]